MFCYPTICSLYTVATFMYPPKDKFFLEGGRGGGGGCEQAIIWMIQFMSEGSSHVVPNSYALQG